MPVTESTYFCRHGIDRSKFGCPKCMCPHRVDTNFRVCNSCIPPAVPVLAPTPDPRLLSDEQLAEVRERELRSNMFSALDDRHALLRHIAALTEQISALTTPVSSHTATTTQEGFLQWKQC